VTSDARRCLWADCGETLLDDAYQNPWGGWYCNERCAILDLIEKSLAQLRDPQHQNVRDLRSIAISALREAQYFALGVAVDPRPTSSGEDTEVE
jgi:hypothetical protein